jgi:hypothetical protein
MLRPLLLGLGLAFITSSLDAQTHGAWIRGPAPSVLFMERTTAAWRTAARDTTARVVRPTHWKRGLLIGGAIGAVGLGGLVYALCEGLKETQESCLGPALGGAALGAFIGGTVGALIGGQFPQRADSLPVADSTSFTP